MCDALFLQEFTDAVKAGDSGRVVLVLKIWALGFRGNGRTKYAYDMLHFIHHITNVWPKGFQDIVLKNWLLNTTGNPNSFCEFDLIQEHLNFWVKNTYKVHGSNLSWEWLETMAPLQCSTKNQGTQHAPPELTDDIEALMDSLHKNNMYWLKRDQILDDGDEPVKDVIALGLRSLKDGSKSPLSERLQTRRHMHPPTEVDMIFDDLQRGISESTLKRLSAFDVVLDMDEFPVEYNDSSSSKSKAEDEE
ncbi:hypothetical protein B0H34DRAFT_783353 [Crassisporium funariophilum]|nr:hypothetical protein B0H34DRAFT_783353 [Crassisporium funariophilum]